MAKKTKRLIRSQILQPEFVGDAVNTPIRYLRRMEDVFIVLKRKMMKTIMYNYE